MGKPSTLVPQPRPAARFDIYWSGAVVADPDAIDPERVLLAAQLAQATFRGAKNIGPAIIDAAQKAVERRKDRNAARRGGKGRGQQQTAAAEPERKRLREVFAAARRKNPRVSELRVAQLEGIDVKTLRAALGKKG